MNQSPIPSPGIGESVGARPLLWPKHHFTKPDIADEIEREGFRMLQRRGFTLREIAYRTGKPYEVVRKALYDDVVRT